MGDPDVTRFHSKEFAVPGSATATRDFSETYLATAAGLTLKYRAAERVSCSPALVGA